MKDMIRLIALYKAVTGMLALIAGIAAVIYGPASVHNLVIGMARAELQEDPTDFLANFLMPYLSFYSSSGFYLIFMVSIIIGLAHLLLGYEILHGRHWPIVWLFWVLAAALPFEIASMVHSPKASGFLLVAVNSFIVGYLYLSISERIGSFRLQVPFREK
jgi:uncharacterized membrane protein